MVALNAVATFDSFADGSAVATGTGVSSVNGTAPLVRTASAIRGARGVRFNAASGTASWIGQTIAASQTIAIASHYFWIDSANPPSGFIDFVLIRNSTANMARARLNTDRTVVISDADVTSRLTSGVLPSGKYILNMSVTMGTTATNGRIAAWIRNADTGALLYSVDIATINTGTTAPTTVRHGKTGGTGAPYLDSDEIGVGWGTFGEANYTVPVAAPTVNAGANQTVESWDNITLTATSSESDVVWTQISGASASLVDPPGKTATGTAPPSLTGQTLIFRATATNSGGSATSDVSVTVNPATRATLDGTPIRRMTMDGTTIRTIQL